MLSEPSGVTVGRRSPIPCADASTSTAAAAETLGRVKVALLFTLAKSRLAAGRSEKVRAKAAGRTG